MTHSLESKYGQKLFKKLHPLFDVVLSILIIFMIIGLFITIGYEVYHMYENFYHNQIDQSIHKGLFIFILVEMYQVLALYLRDKEIKIIVIINIALVSIMRELIFEMSDMQWEKGLVFIGILTVLGTLYFFDRRFVEKSNAHISI